MLQLKANLPKAAYDTDYIIEGPAALNVFESLPALAHIEAKSIKFTDNDGNYVVLNIADSKVDVYARIGAFPHVSFSHLPANFAEYSLYVERVQGADVAAIEQWKSATKINLVSRLEPSQDLMDRLNAIPVLTVGIL